MALPPHTPDTIKDSSHYWAGYRDGFAGYPPVPSPNAEYLLGYQHGQEDSQGTPWEEEEEEDADNEETLE